MHSKLSTRWCCMLLNNKPWPITSILIPKEAFLSHVKPLYCHGRGEEGGTINPKPKHHVLSTWWKQISQSLLLPLSHIMSCRAPSCPPTLGCNSVLKLWSPGSAFYQQCLHIKLLDFTVPLTGVWHCTLPSCLATKCRELWINLFLGSLPASMKIVILPEVLQK